ncbi:DUF4145 domain-containing protein [Salinimicrobium catena]|uniref:DUF4145 domain-containing protein n=1 Tax=Salinimicrobium catena TaxID=390640 RepID=UPI002FE46075
MKKKLFCRTCKGLRNQTLKHQIEKKGSDEDEYFRWIQKYAIIECDGCETISFLHIYGDTEMFYRGEEGEQIYFDDETIYPTYLDKSYEIETTRYIPDKIGTIYLETIAALKVDSYILTAGGFRAIIEAICNHLEIRKDNLEERINLLHKKGHLTISESKRLHSIRFLGNDALHELEKPRKDHLYILLDIVNHLLHNLFINDEKIRDQLELYIDNYEDFIKLIKNKISSDLIGKEISLIELIGKAKRLFPKGKMAELEKEFIKQIKENKYDFIKIGESKEEQKYEIMEVPSIFGLWPN